MLMSFVFITATPDMEVAREVGREGGETWGWKSIIFGSGDIHWKSTKTFTRGLKVVDKKRNGYL
jgi:hypothetical protein